MDLNKTGERYLSTEILEMHGGCRNTIIKIRSDSDEELMIISSDVETAQELLEERLPELEGEGCVPEVIALARVVLAVAGHAQPLQVVRLRGLLLDVDGAVEDSHVAADGEEVVPEEPRQLQVPALHELGVAQGLVAVAEGGGEGPALRLVPGGGRPPAAVTHQGEVELDQDLVVALAVATGVVVVVELEEEGGVASVLPVVPVGVEADPPGAARRLEPARVDALAGAVHGLDPLVALDLEHVALGGGRGGHGGGHGHLR